jgi:hypothetical protein
MRVAFSSWGRGVVWEFVLRVALISSSAQAVAAAAPTRFLGKTRVFAVSVGRHVRNLRHLATALLVLASACSKGAEPGACMREHENACIEYGRDVATAGKRMCAGMKWEARCPPSGRLGTCAKKDGTEFVYGGPPNNYSPATAKSACEWAGGTFTATGPGSAP